MQKKLWLKGSPTQFRNLIEIFHTYEHLEHGLADLPAFRIVSADNDLVDMQFRNPGFLPSGSWGTVIVESNPDGVTSHLTMYAYDGIWDDVKDAWDALYVLMIERGFIGQTPMAATPTDDPKPHPPRDVLTDRQKKIADLIADGWTDGEIAKELTLSAHTLKGCRKQIRVELGIEGKLTAGALKKILKKLGFGAGGR